MLYTLLDGKIWFYPKNLKVTKTGKTFLVSVFYFLVFLHTLLYVEKVKAWEENCHVNKQSVNLREYQNYKVITMCTAVTD